MIKKLPDFLPEGLYFIDDDLRIRYANPEFERLTGSKNVVGKELKSDLIRYQDEAGHALELYEFPAFLCYQTKKEVRKNLYIISAGERIPVEERCRPVFKGEKLRGVLSIIKDLNQVVSVIEKNLSEKRRQSLIPICAWCKKVRTGDDFWESIESYLINSGAGNITHGICPDCAEKIFEKKVYLESYQDICRAISSSLSLKEVLNLIVTNVVKVLKVKACMLRLLNKETNRLEVAAHYGLSEKYINKGPVDFDQTIKESLQGKTISIYDITRDEQARYRKEAEQEGIKSIISVPVKAGKEILGVLRLYTSEPVLYLEEDLRFIPAIAVQASIAIVNARTFELSLTKAKEYLRVFEEVTKAVTSKLELQDVLDTIVKKLPAVMGLRAATIRLLTEDGSKLILVASHGLSRRYLERGPVDLEENVKEALQAKPVAISDVTVDPRVKYQKEAEEEGIKSMLTLPIIARGKVIGILRLLTDVQRQFSEEEINFAASLAEVCGIAIDNARFYNKKPLL
ncbi:MAG: GAF domain-containing protein [Thermodesulfovibrionales bacterium]|nr:GAF domain-containing protein [Thermodesulfovibrionales bacterium]